MVTTVYTLCLIILWNCVKSQSNNDTNETFIPTTTDIITTTQFFTSIDIVTTGDPTIDPTIEPTSDPTSISTTLYTTTADPIYERYTGFVEASMIDANGNSAPIQYSSFPVNYEPYQYTLYNETFFHMLDEVINPCDVSSIISKYNASDIDGKIVGLDARSINSKYESVLGDCNYQQWTLNIESLGAKGVLLGVNKPFRNYAGDNSLSTPTIPTRFIDIDDLTNFAFSLDIGGIVQILVTLEAFENEYPALICIEDSNYGKDDFWRINGNYEQRISKDENGNPYWIQDATYNLGSAIDWILRFEVDSTYNNWVISSDFTNNLIAAYCTDSSISANDAPSSCSAWHENNKTSGNPKVSDTLMVFNDLCPAPDSNANTTNYCIKSTANNIKNYIGTYTQLIEGIPEWFNDNTDGGEVAILYWSEDVLVTGPFEPDDTGYGWIISAGNERASCLYSEDEQDPSQSNPIIRYQPQLCTNWRDNTYSTDTTFDIDANICENDKDSNITLICVTYQPDDDGDEVYSAWSGSYDITTNNVTINNFQVWTFIYDDNEYNILYDEIGDQWVITKDIDILDDDDYFEIEDDNIIASCMDNKGLGSNPMKCSGEWIVKDATNNNIPIIFEEINDENECDAPIITTTRPTPSPTNIDEGKGESSKSFIESFSIGEYIAIGAALLAFPLCIVCFVCYQRRKEKRKNTDQTDGISLQPYVPTGMAYDSYKQNQSHKQATKRGSTKIKKPGPTSVTSASGSVDEDAEEINSRNALINVFDEDGPNNQQTTPIGDDEDDANPFLDDEIIKTGQTLIDDEGPLATDEVMSAFDE